MWIERVVAHAFGPFVNQRLELAEGLTVVYGPNEAGKTSWHAAIRMALTGVRRGRGSSTREAAELEDRHRSWDQPDGWQVEARLHLRDGRTIDLSQDLAGRVACRAIDVALGQDVSAEITTPNGTPDAAIWLGLDRDAFAVTLSVSQSEILAVADSPADLQEHMQRAAASASTDATAARAIERLVAFRRDAVGADTSVARGPLRSAMRALDAAEAALAEARRRHAAYLERQAEAEAAARNEARARQAYARATLAEAEARSAALAARVARAEVLAARYPQTPAALTELDDQATQVAAALGAWRHLPAVRPRAGRAVAEIEAELRQLAERPDTRSRDEADLAAAEAALKAITDVPAGPGARRVDPWLLVAGGILAAALIAGLGGAAIVAAVAGVGGVAIVGWRLAVRPSQGPTIDPGVTDAEARVAAAREAVWRGRASAETDALRSAALQRELDAARAAAAAEAEAVAQDDALRRRIADAARLAGLDPDGPTEGLVSSLETWLAARQAAIAAGQTAIGEYQELTDLLADQTLHELRAAAEAAESERARLAAEVGASGDEGPPPTVAAARRDLDEAQKQAAAAAREVAVLAAEMPDVAEAEEARSAAEQRLAQVQELGSVIDQTLDLLRGAQRRVHQDLAPILKSTIDRWLPEITGGTYVESGVNPADLSIEVKEARTGRWRAARLLSEGTREQIYLILRVAMARHLVTTDEVAPMLLDEVTAQADELRRQRLLEMAHQLSAERQIVLFSHDAAVRDWARARLHGPRDRLVELTPVVQAT